VIADSGGFAEEWNFGARGFDTSKKENLV